MPLIDAQERDVAVLLDRHAVLLTGVELAGELGRRWSLTNWPDDGVVEHRRVELPAVSAACRPAASSKGRPAWSRGA